MNIIIKITYGGKNLGGSRFPMYTTNNCPPIWIVRLLRMDPTYNNLYERRMLYKILMQYQPHIPTIVAYFLANKPLMDKEIWKKFAILRELPESMAYAYLAFNVPTYKRRSQFEKGSYRADRINPPTKEQRIQVGKLFNYAKTKDGKDIPITLELRGKGK